MCLGNIWILLDKALKPPTPTLLSACWVLEAVLGLEDQRRLVAAFTACWICKVSEVALGEASAKVQVCLLFDLCWRI